MKLKTILGLKDLIFSKETWLFHTVVSRKIYIHYFILTAVLFLFGLLAMLFGFMDSGFFGPKVTSPEQMFDTSAFWGKTGLMFFKGTIFTLASFIWTWLSISVAAGRSRDIFGGPLQGQPAAIAITVFTLIPYLNLFSLFLFLTQKGVLTENRVIEKGSLIESLENIFPKNRSSSTSYPSTDDNSKVKSNNDLVTQIERLAALRKEGSLSEEEYEKMKSELLS